MNRRELILGACVAPAALSLAPHVPAFATGADALLTKADVPGFGAYDPYGDFSSDKSANIEHIFLPWEDVDLASLPAADAYALAHGRDLLITIEPWTWSADWRVSANELRARIEAGRYDANMKAIADAVGQMKSRTTIRWAQEMENKTGRFTWSEWVPDHYIGAYRRMVDIARQSSPKTRYMWSPKGDEGLQPYYPGDNYVDMIGLSVFGLQKWDIDKYGRNQTYVDVLGPEYQRVHGFGKPVVVAELGYVGDADYVGQWEEDSRKHYSQFPALTSVVYFNQKEVWPWPDGYGLPDWRVTHHIIA